VELLQVGIDEEGVVLRQERFDRLGRAGAESRLDRVAVDVRILDD
jgi:hypothetical protein